MVSSQQEAMQQLIDDAKLEYKDLVYGLIQEIETDYPDLKHQDGWIEFIQRLEDLE